jgi:DnaJ family protein B protein 4
MGGGGGGGGQGGFSGFPGGFGGGGMRMSPEDAQNLFAQFFGGGGFGGFSGEMDDDDDGMHGFSSRGGRQFQSMPGGMGGFGGMGGMPPRQPRGPQKAPPVETPLALTLEELYTGVTKRLKITRKVMNSDGRSYHEEDKLIEIPVKAGWKSGTKVTFEKHGDEAPGMIPADMVFTIQEKPHYVFERQGNNLIHKANIALKSALIGGEVLVKHLDGRQIKVPFSGPVSNGSQQIVPGEGMPISKSGGRSKGDLIVKFNVVFPTTLSADAKAKLRDINF